MVEDRCIQLNLIDEHRLQAMHHAQCYQKQAAIAYQKKVRPRNFQPGDLVLRAIHLQIAEANSGPTGAAPLWSSESSPAAQQSLRTWTRLNSQNRSIRATSRSTTSSLEPSLPCRASLFFYSIPHIHSLSCIFSFTSFIENKKIKNNNQKSKSDALQS